MPMKKTMIAAIFGFVAIVLASGATAQTPNTTRPSAIDMLTANCVATHVLIGGTTTPGCGPVFGSSNVASTLVQRDGSGNFSAGTITAASLLSSLFNGLAITNNGTNTLAIAAGKTLTASNTLTFTGTDGSSVAFGTGGTVLYGNQTITLSGDVSGSGSTTITTVLTTAQPAIHTWALAQTFTTAPVFSDQSGSRTALGLGTMATQAASAVAITGGTINASTIGAVTPSSGAFTTLAASTSGLFGGATQGLVGVLTTNANDGDPTGNVWSNNYMVVGPGANAANGGSSAAIGLGVTGSASVSIAELLAIAPGSSYLVMKYRAASHIFYGGGSAIGLTSTVTGGITIGSPTGGDKGSGTVNPAGPYYSNGTKGVTCSGPLTVIASISISNGIVTAATGTGGTCS